MKLAEIYQCQCSRNTKEFTKKAQDNAIDFALRKQQVKTAASEKHLN